MDIREATDNPIVHSDFLERVVELTNQERTQFDLSPLTVDSLLTQAAPTHTENMAVQDFYEHIGLDGSSGGDHIEATGYDFSAWAENIAVGYQIPEAVVKAWMNSAGHGANILHQDFQEIGVGYYFLEEDTGSVNAYHYWTQVFSTPDNTLEIFNPTYNPAVTSDFPERVVELTNQERTQLNLSPLTLDPLLNQTAQTHTENMAV